jgi:cell fate regulator YaaT (PSP1 superfamily)
MEENAQIHISRRDLTTSRGCCSGGNPLLMNAGAEQKCAKLATFDWLKDLPLPGGSTRFDCAEVRFKNNHKDFFKIPQGTTVYPGDIVAVEASPGHDIGIVTLTGETARLQMLRKNVNPNKEDLRKLYRKAKQADVDKWLTAISHEHDALYKTRVAALRLGLKMKVNDVEYQGDDTKAIFYYTAEDRVDFRELIKILAEELKIRIEMRQIGMRQEASRLGGIGSCGRELCCSTWISGFHSVSTSAARVQQLSPNPQKLAGQCSKLKCCLNYEVEAYADALKGFPDDNSVLKTKQGDVLLQKIDVFGGTMWFGYKGKEHEMFALTVERVKEVIELNKAGKIPEKIEDFTIKQDKKPVIGLVVASEDLHRFDKKKQGPNRRPDKREKRS